MMMSGGKLKETQVSLMLSSRAEMQKVIETARQKALSFMQLTQQPSIAPLTVPTPVPAPVPVPSVTMPGHQPQPPIISLPGFLAQSLVQTTSTLGLGATSLDLPSYGLAQTSTLPTKMLLNNYNNDKSDREDSKDKNDRRVRSRRSRSRSRSKSRERRRSRSRDRTSSSRRRRERSRSRSRERRRYRRSRSRSPGRTSKHSDSRDRERPGTERVRERVSRFSNRTSPVNTISQLDANKLTSGGVWSMMTTQLPITPNYNTVSSANVGIPPPLLASTGLNQYPLKSSNTVYSTQDTEKILDLEKNRNPSAFQSMNFNSNSNGSSNSILNANTNGVGSKPTEVWNLMDAPNPITNAPCCVSISNMNPITGYGEIRRFFQGLFINNNGIKMLNDNQGSRTGVAYVKFARDDSVSKALELSGNFLKQCKVEVAAIPDALFEDAVDSFKPTRFGNNMNNKRNDYDNDERRARSRSYDDDRSSDRDHDDYNNDDSKDDDDEDVKIVSVEKTGDDRNKNNNEPKTTLVLENIPSYAKEQDILHTFSNYSLLDVTIDKSQDSRQLQALVKFNSVEDVELILKNKDNYRVLSKDVNISLYSEKEKDSDTEYVPKSTSMDRSSDRTYTNGGSRDPRNYMRSSSSESRPRVSRFSDIRSRSNYDPKNKNNTEITDSECVVLKNLDCTTRDRDVVDFFSDIGVVPVKVHILLNTNGTPSGDCFCEFSTCEEAEKALRKNNNTLGSKTVLISSVARRKVDYVLNSFNGTVGDMGGVTGGNHFGNNTSNYHGNRDNNSYNRGYSSTNNGGTNRSNYSGSNSMSSNGSNNVIPLNPETSPDNFGKPGCVVNMANVPYRAGVDDIIQFYKDHNISQQNVIRRFNDLGQPTGDARVCFASSSEAQRALSSYHQNKIHGRTIFLSIL